MRHLWSLLAGVIAAPLAWLLLAIGQHNSQRQVERWEQAGRFDTADLIGPVIFLIVAGLLLGVLGTLRWSPAGSVAAGALLLLPTIFMFINPLRTLEFFSYDQPRRLLWQDFHPWLPVANGTLLALGALLLVAMASLQRWRRWPVLPAPIPPATDEQVIAGVTELTQDAGSSPMSDDEILAAAAAIDEQLERAGPADQPSPTEPPEQPADQPSPAEPPAQPTGDEPEPERPPRPPADEQRPGGANP